MHCALTENPRRWYFNGNQKRPRWEAGAAIIVSQDWDFGPAVRLAKEIAQAQDRRLVYESAFPVGPGSLSRRGVPGTTWVPLDQAAYDGCRDPKGLSSEEAVSGLPLMGRSQSPQPHLEDGSTYHPLSASVTEVTKKLSVS